MVSRGYTKSSWFLIDVEAGFELWQGGAGLATNSFSVNIGGGSPSSAPATATAAPSPSTQATTSTGSCSVAYSVDSSWPGGFLGRAVVTNTGTSTLNGWKLGWTFPGDQAIDDLWNGDSSQSGSDVAVTNASYDGELASGASTTVGFIATYSGSDTTPSSLSCT
jgi:cellulose 1,4-beta-cellobiosidase